MLQPNALVLYVDDLAISAKFYEDLLEKKPEESSPTFNMFSATNGMGLGLKCKNTVDPTAGKNDSGELAFIVENDKKIDELFTEWQKKGVTIMQSPTVMSFGYTFLAVDPDGNRLRIVSLGKS